MKEAPSKMGGAHQTVNMHSGIMNCPPCLSLWERWPSEARTERGDQGAIPSQSPAVTALPEGEPRDCTPHYVAYWHENGAYLYRYAPFTVLRPPIKEVVSLGQHRTIRQEVSGRIFCSNSKFRKWRNTVCISHFRNCGSGAKRRLRLADAIVRCCLSFMPDKSPCRPAWFRSSPAWRPTPAARAC